MISDWPEYREDRVFTDEAETIELVKESVRRVRDMRTSHNVPPSKEAAMYIVSGDEAVLAKFRAAEGFFGTLAKASSVSLQKDKSGIADDAFSVIVPDAVLYIPFSDLVDIEKEKERLNKEVERLGKEIARSNGMLGNEKFISKAPAEKVQAERDKLENYTKELEQVKASLAKFEGR
jgi:valyl-tRNA synthetase